MDIFWCWLQLHIWTTRAGTIDNFFGSNFNSAPTINRQLRTNDVQWIIPESFFKIHKSSRKCTLNIN